MNITFEMAGLFITASGLILGGLWAILGRLDRIWAAISRIEKNYVEHETCEKRRDRCPCMSEVEELKEDFKRIKERKII